MENYMGICTSAGVGTSKTKYIGYECKVGCELLINRWKLHQAIHPETTMVLGDFTKNIDLLAELYKEKGCSGIVFTLPCQPFSLAGGQHIGDDLTWLFLDAIKLIKKIEEIAHIEWLFWENAPYFIRNNQSKIITERLSGKTILEYIKDELEPYGYIFNSRVLNANDYGTAQSRERAIILARKNKKWEMPEADEKRLTLRDAIGDRSRFKMLESDEYDENNEFHRCCYVEPNQAAWLKKTPTGCEPKDENGQWLINNKDGTKCKAKHRGAYRRMKWNEAAPTVIQESDSVSGDNNIHPGELLPNGLYSDPRPLTVAELFAVTGVDDEFISAIPKWARPNDKLLREICGEALMPNLLNRCLEMLKQ